MGIKTIPLSQLENNLRKTLSECAASGDPYVVELPEGKLVAIQALEPSDDDALIDELLESNPAFQELLSKSKAGHRKPFLASFGD